MTIAERIVGEIALVEVNGRLTADERAEELPDKVRSLLQQNYKQIVVNLGNVPYMDSSGLGALVQTYATTKKQGGALKLLNITKRLNDVLVITKLANVFECFDDERAALASFAADA